MMALKTFQRHVHLAVKLTILVAVLFPRVSGNDCSGDGSVMDTCPEGEYCEAGSCYNCSLCSVNALLQGVTPTKCLCIPSSHKICAMPASGEQLIENPSQLSFTNLTGYEGMDLTYLKESYDRSNIDCTVPTTPKGTTTSVAFMSTTSTTTVKSEEPEPTKGIHVYIIVIAVVVVAIIVGLISWIVCFRKGKSFCGNQGGKNSGVESQDQADQGEKGNPEQVPLATGNTENAVPV